MEDLYFMTAYELEKSSDNFKEDVKQLLTGNISADDVDMINYLALRITRLYEERIKQICGVEES